jgi:hypothetical protein
MAGGSQIPTCEPTQSDAHGSRTEAVFKSEHDIRILTLLPGRFGSTLKGELKTRSLDRQPTELRDATSEESLIKYDALSYTWGSIEREYAIQIQGASDIKISKNLWVALQHLRHRSSSQNIWADQICIDQNNVQERNHQVKLMAEVYRQADQVLVWIGTSQGFRSSNHDERLRWLDDKLIVPITRLLFSANRMEYALLLSESPWPFRGWVLQEALLATKSPVICVDRLRLQQSGIGSFHCWVCRLPRRVRSKNYFCNHCQASTKGAAWTHVLHILHLRGAPNQYRDILDLIEFMQESETHDPRDKIYSLLSLLEDSMREAIEPDYDAPVAFVYAQATAAYMNIHRTFLVFGMALRLRAEYSSIGPSWSMNFLRHHPVYDVQQAAREIFQLEPKQWIASQPQLTHCFDFDRAYTRLSITTLEFDEIVGAEPTDTHCPHLGQFTHPVDLYEASSQLSLPYSTILQDPKDETRRDDSPYDALHSGQPFSALSSLWQEFCSQWANDPTPWSRELRQQHVGVFSAWRSCFARCGVGHDESMEAHRTEVYKRWCDYLDFRAKIYHTSRGFLGIGGESVQAGDRIVLPHGSRTPLILRANDDGETFTAISFTYIEGIMQGELLEYPDLPLPERRFVLT